MNVTYSDINCIAELFSVEDIIPLINEHFKSSLKDLETDIIPLLKKYDEFEELLADWREQFSRNFRDNLADVIKKDKLLPQFMRVLSIPFPELFQTELYLFEKEPRVPFSYGEEDMILMQLMLLKAHHKTKTPSNTIRKLKYKTQEQFTP